MLNGLAVRLLRGLVLGYQWVLSPILPVSCRFAPTCSSYALEALRSFGALRGSWLALRRISRCHPWGGSGFDPVPPCPSAGTNAGAECRHPRRASEQMNA